MRFHISESINVCAEKKLDLTIKTPFWTTAAETFFSTMKNSHKMIFAIVEMYISLCLSLFSFFHTYSFSVPHFHPPDLNFAAVTVVVVVVAEERDFSLLFSRARLSE